MLGGIVKMSVETVDVMMKVPKEGKEIVDAIAALTKHFVNGGNIADAAQHLGLVVTAVDGVNKLGEEVTSQYSDELAAYAGQKIWDALKKAS